MCTKSIRITKLIQEQEEHRRFMQEGDHPANEQTRIAQDQKVRFVQEELVIVLQ